MQRKAFGKVELPTEDTPCRDSPEWSIGIETCILRELDREESRF